MIQSENPGKMYAAVCGLYCKACTLFIATQEGPERLTQLAAQFGVTEDDIICKGCRSDLRTPYCQRCKMFACAKEKGIDFCSECDEFPCAELKTFQSEMPHRADLWEELEKIKEKGYNYWLKSIEQKYTCPDCGTINSAYDLKCRKCGHEPGNQFIEKHKKKIVAFVNKK